MVPERLVCTRGLTAIFIVIRAYYREFYKFATILSAPNFWAKKTTLKGGHKPQSLEQGGGRTEYGVEKKTLTLALITTPDGDYGACNVAGII